MNKPAGAKSSAWIEPLEDRRLASASYVRVGVLASPMISQRKAVYFTKTSLPAGDYLVAYAGGAMCYRDFHVTIVWKVNDYGTGNYGFKIVQPGGGVKAINAPGTSFARHRAGDAEADSAGQVVKFRHSVAGRIAIELQDNPYDDNKAASNGGPMFILKRRTDTVLPASTATITTAASTTKAASFSTAAIVKQDEALTSLVD